MTCAPVVHTSSLYITLAQFIGLILLISAVAYALRRRGLAWAHRSMQKAEAELHALEHEKELLAQNQRDLDQQILEQEALFEQLYKAVERWRVSQELERHVLEERHHELSHRVATHMKLREATLHAQYLRERVVPQAREQVRTLLKEKFSLPSQGHIFLSALCARIEQEKL